MSAKSSLAADAKRLFLGPLLRTLSYLWAGPTTLLGLLAGVLTLGTGGRVRRHGPVVELWGGFSSWLLGCRLFRAEAMTLGHVILGRTERALDLYRSHELEHVRQATLWGVFFLPAYGLASLWAHLTGRHYYRDNWFEVDANRRDRTRQEPSC